MDELDFDKKTDVILDKMCNQFRLTTGDIQTIVMFCTMFKDEYCNAGREINE